MTQYLYHRILPENHLQYISPVKILEEGITHETVSNSFYMNVGRGNSEILNKYRPTITPEWLNFNKAIGCDLILKYSKAFAFPVFTKKILIFNADIASQIYDQEFYISCNGTFEEAENFDTGLTLDELYKKYWESMILYEEYLQDMQYKNPQVLVFEPIPKDILRAVERDL